MPFFSRSLCANFACPHRGLPPQFLRFHPVMVESVDWITEIKNTLSTAFFLGSILTYLRFESLEEDETPRDWKWFGISLVLFLCALLSKSVTCTLPVVLAILIWWKRPRLRPAD